MTFSAPWRHEVEKFLTQVTLASVINHFLDHHQSAESRLEMVLSNQYQIACQVLLYIMLCSWWSRSQLCNLHNVVSTMYLLGLNLIYDDVMIVIDTHCLYNQKELLPICNKIELRSEYVMHCSLFP